ncbi:hypothetical protein Scep_015166 [Stephania cephalantha]|uniref:CASP-like protein n=2 Tax=Stephania TaxID=147243 RepID=A0AAP0J3H8_9MAGN
MSKSGEATSINIPAEAKSSSSGTRAAPVVSTTKSTRLARTGWKKGMAILDFLLRLITLAAALAAAVSMGTTDQILPFFTQHFQFEAQYDDFPAFLFLVIADAIAAGYLAFSLLFSIFTIIRHNAVGVRLLLLILDTVMVALTATAAGAAAAIVYLAHDGSSSANWVAICEQFDDFCKQTSGAAVAGFVVALLFMLMVVMSALCIRKH